MVSIGGNGDAMVRVVFAIAIALSGQVDLYKSHNY